MSEQMDEYKIVPRTAKTFKISQFSDMPQHKGKSNGIIYEDGTVEYVSEIPINESPEAEYARKIQEILNSKSLEKKNLADIAIKSGQKQ